MLLRLVFFHSELYQDNVRTDEKRIFQSHRKRLARQAKVLIAEQAILEASRKPQPLHFGNNRDMILPKLHQEASMFRFLFGNIERWWPTRPDQATELAAQESEYPYYIMERSFTHTNPSPPSVPTVNDAGELIWEEPQQQDKQETRQNRD